MNPATVRRFRESRVGPVGLALVSMLALLAFVGPWLASSPEQAYRDVLIDEVGLPRGPFEVEGHLLGGDVIGRDELARLVVVVRIVREQDA